MADEKKQTSNSTPVARKKRPTLSEKVKKQAELIDALNIQIDQKNQALAISEGHAKLIETLSSELKHMENRVGDTAEQNTLIEELTNKIQEIEIKLLGSSLQNKQADAQNTVKMHMIAGMTLGLLPAPLFDIAALTGTQINLLRSLSTHYAVDFDEQLGKTLVASLVSGSIPVLTVVGLSSFAKIIPGIGTIGGGIGMTVISGAVIYATGQVFIRHFEAGGTFDDFDANHWKSYFKEQLEEGKKAVKKKRESLSSSKPEAMAEAV